MNRFSISQLPERVCTTSDPDHNFKDSANSTTLLMSRNESVIQQPTGKNKRPLKWSEKDTYWFFTCLEMYGRDFKAIRRILSHKSISQIDRKFNTEVKRNPTRVTQALNAFESSVLTGCPRSAPSLIDVLFDEVYSESEELDTRKTEQLLFLDGDLGCWNGGIDFTEPDRRYDDIKPLSFYLDESVEESVAGDRKQVIGLQER